MLKIKKSKLKIKKFIVNYRFYKNTSQYFVQKTAGLHLFNCKINSVV